MDDVARKARVSRALVYLYFKNKIELQFAICLRALTLLREQLAAAAETPPRGDDKIAAIGAAYMRFAEQHPLYFATLSKIGRGSFRDRVCRYVWISVVAV